MRRAAIAPFFGTYEIDECYISGGGWRHHLREWLAEIEMRYECGVARFHDELLKILVNSSV